MKLTSRVYRFVRGAGLDRAKNVPLPLRKRRYAMLQSVEEAAEEK